MPYRKEAPIRKRFADNHCIQPFIVTSPGQFTQRKFPGTDNTPGTLTLPLCGKRLLKPFNRTVKRTFDIIFSTLTIAILAVPVMLPIAVAVKISSPGPILFRQKRNGYHGKEFICYKFRSMVVNADSDDSLTARNDWRITKIGAFLRRTSLDELPQFFNILKGDMSVVGPRPHMIKQTDKYRHIIEDYMVRHAIKPGITGWAQINNLRGTTETPLAMKRRVQADIWYIDNWTPALDIKIILRTIYNIIFTHEERAY